MKLHRTILAGAGVAALALAVLAAPTLAQTAQQKAQVDQAKAQGLVGEQADGYLGVRVASVDADVREAVRVTNEGRMRAYERSAAQAGTTAAVAGARMFELNLLPRISTGEWYRNAQGQWVQR